MYSAKYKRNLPSRSWDTHSEKSGKWRGLEWSIMFSALTALILLTVTVIVTLRFSSSQPGTDQQILIHPHHHSNNNTKQHQPEISTKDYINEQFSVDQLLSTWPSHRPKAAFTILCRNSDLSAILKSIKDLEARFNSQHGYPYIFLNDKPFTKQFKDTIRAETTARSFFGLIPSDHWRLPDSLSVA